MIVILIIINPYIYIYISTSQCAVTCNVTTLLHVFLNVMESRKQVPSAAHTLQLVMTDISHTAAEANTCTWATAGARF